MYQFTEFALEVFKKYNTYEEMPNIITINNKTSMLKEEFIQKHQEFKKNYFNKYKNTVWVK